MHPLDVFIKNTHEILGPLHRATAYTRLTRLEFVTSDRSVRKATYGRGKYATDVTVNFGPDDVEIKSTHGGTVVLPGWGFVVEGPRFAAFHAKQWNGEEYDSGALFTVQSRTKAGLGQPSRVRVFHAFGSPRLKWRGKLYEVQRESMIDIR